MLNETAIPQILASVPNAQLLKVSSSLRQLSRYLSPPLAPLAFPHTHTHSLFIVHVTRALLHETRDAKKNASRLEPVIKANQDISKSVSKFAENIAKIKSHLSDASDQMRFLLRIKSREASQFFASQVAGGDFNSPHLVENLMPIAEAAMKSYSELVLSPPPFSLFRIDGR